MGLQDVIALTLALAAAVYMGRLLVKMMTGSKGCACGKVSRPADSHGSGQPDSRQPNSRQLRRLPLVTIEQVGRPHATGRTSEHHATRHLAHTEQLPGNGTEAR